jgi:peroxiredoxin (alkyl hydroperoxide reductase subunit C)
MYTINFAKILKLDFMKTQLYLSLILATLISLQLTAQDIEEYRIPLLGESAPEFTANSTMGEINFPSDYFSKWKIIFSHPADFTPVCTSEILTLAALQDEFQDLNTEIVVVSTDGINSHIEWVHSIESINYNNLGRQEINFPLISDVNLEICRKYGMVEANSGRTNSIRGVFIIDPDDRIRSINFYSVETGRNFDETIRALKALQLSDNKGILTPANWEPGDAVMIPSPATMKEAKKLESKNDPSLKMITWYMWMKTL